MYNDDMDINFEEQFQLVAEFFLRCKEQGKDVAKYEKAMSDIYFYANGKKLNCKLLLDKNKQYREININLNNRLKIYDEKFGS